MTPLPNDEYRVGWICALPKEMAAARYMFDEYHGDIEEQDDSDTNSYCAGKIGRHNVVVGCLPRGVCGAITAAEVARNMLSTFKGIRFGLLVGTGGGAPSEKNDIRLGDVVVSTPSAGFGGVLPHDTGKLLTQGFQVTGSCNKPPDVLLTAVSKLEGRHLGEGNRISDFVSQMVEQYQEMDTNGYSFDQGRPDQLFESDYIHEGNENSCFSCDKSRLIKRRPRKNLNPKVHYGLVASGNQLMKSATSRDKLASDHGVLCFEMEAAGLMDRFPSLVIRGICNYADSHKNDIWQEYAAATAAAYAKELLSVIPGNKVAITPIAREIVTEAQSKDTFALPRIDSILGISEFV